MNRNTDETKVQERLDFCLNALDKCYHARTAVKADRQKYLVRFLSILDKCPHALPPNTSGKALARHFEDGARTLQETFPDHVPFEPAPMPVNYAEAEYAKESTCFELALLLLEKYPNAIKEGIGGEGLVRAIKEIAETVGAYLVAPEPLSASGSRQTETP